MNFLKHIYRYPIKGLSAEELDKITLKENDVLPGDREFAFARSHINYNQKNPIFLKKTNFLALVNEEKLARLKTKFNYMNKNLIIYLDNKILVNEYLVDNKSISNSCIIFLFSSIPSPYLQMTILLVFLP